MRGRARPGGRAQRDSEAASTVGARAVAILNEAGRSNSNERRNHTNIIAGLSPALDSCASRTRGGEDVAKTNILTTIGCAVLIVAAGSGPLSIAGEGKVARPAAVRMEMATRFDRAALRPAPRAVQRGAIGQQKLGNVGHAESPAPSLAGCDRGAQSIQPNRRVAGRLSTPWSKARRPSISTLHAG